MCRARRERHHEHDEETHGDAPAGMDAADRTRSSSRIVSADVSHEVPPAGAGSVGHGFFFFFTALLRCFPLSFSVLLFPIPLVDYLFSFLFSLGSFSPPLDPHQIKR